MAIYRHGTLYTHGSEKMVISEYQANIPQNTLAIFVLRNAASAAAAAKQIISLDSFHY